VHGQGFQPGSTVTIVAHSAPIQLGNALVNDNGLFDSRVEMPSGLRAGGHHIIVYGTMQNGSAVAQEEAFTVATGGRLGSVGSIPPGDLAKDVAFVPTSHPASVLATIAAAATAIGAVSLALGGGAGSGTGSGGNRDGYLEDVELEREEREVAGGSRGDRSRTWRWPGTRLLDHFSKHLPSRVASISPVAGRVLVDGDYLRAMFGTAWLALCLGAVGLGTYAAASVGWYAFPPSLGIFLAILGLGVVDSTLGYLAGIAFVLSAALAGHLFNPTELRLGAGIVLLWFAVPLAASALRALRRNVHFDAASLWERAADLVIGGLFAAWAAQKMTGALSGLAGIVLVARVESGQPDAGLGYELDAIAAAVIGGTSLSGGVGGVGGTVLGALLIGVISNGLDLLNVPYYYQQIIKGMIIIGAVWLDRRNATRI